VPQASPARCDCARFADELAAAEAVFASRGEDVTSPLTEAAHVRFRARVDDAHARATCLAACAGVPETECNRARVLLAAAGFKTRGLSDALARARLTAALAATERCLATEPGHALCHMWHASARGILARGSWNPLNLRLPRELLAEFRAARGSLAPGHDALEGAATRGEASLLLKAPAIAGGDPEQGRRLLEQAARAPAFPCRVSNRLLLAEALARTGDPGRAVAELSATVAAGLPACGPQRYENALALEEAARCLARLERTPAADPGWDDDCR